MNAQTPVIAPAEEALGAGAPVERSNILIVDDRLDKRVVFRTVLEELDQNIVTASSGEEALRWLLDNDCAVILLDVNMPGMDGLSLTRRIKQDSSTPVVLITAADRRSVEARLKGSAVDSVLFKPFRVDELMAVVNKALSAIT